MSFILDALRKSETDRQRQSTPGLVDAGYRPPARRRALWLPVLIVALAANLVLMGYFWLRREPAPAAPAAEAPVALAEQDAAPPAVAAAEPQGSAASDSAWSAAADLPAVETAPAAAESAPPPGASVPAPAGIVTDDLPSAEALMASGAIPTRPLHLDIHVYNATPAERFVFINMRKYGEGALLPDGAKVEEITRDGVVLSEAGQRFVLNRD